MCLLSDCKKTHDELRKHLIIELNYNDYSYPESTDFRVEGVYTEEPDISVFKELCEYAAVQGNTHYDGHWSGENLYSFLKDKTVDCGIGDYYHISLTFGGLAPVLAVLSYLSVYSYIDMLTVTFTRDKWESRGNRSTKSHVGIKFENGKFLVDTFRDAETEKVDRKISKKKKNEGYKSNEILPSRDMRSRDYDVEKINVTEYKVTSKDKTHKVTEHDGYFWCDCSDFMDEPKNCKHIVAVKRFMNDPFVLYKAPKFRIKAFSAKEMSVDDRYIEIIEELKKAYEGVKTYTLQRLKDEQPNVPFDGLNKWLKNKYGVSATQYLQSIGILFPETYYEVIEDKVDIDELRDKKCCVHLKLFGIYNFEQILTQLGAEIVSDDSADIDYLFVDIIGKIHKEPPSDYSDPVAKLLQKRDDGKIKFSIISRSFIQKYADVIQKMDREILVQKYTDGIK